MTHVRKRDVRCDATCHDLMSSHTLSQSLVEKISVALKDEFKVYLPGLLPQMLSILHADRSKERVLTLKVLHAFQTFGTSLSDYLHLIVPAVVSQSTCWSVWCGGRS